MLNEQLGAGVDPSRLSTRKSSRAGERLGALQANA